MAHTFTNLLTHIVFGTKDRAPSIDDELKPQLFAYMSGIVRELKGKSFAVNGVSDHVHLLVRLPPALPVADAVRLIKANSSKWVHVKGGAGRKFGWQSGYGAFSVSQSNVEGVLRYIATQQEHHRRVTFRDEYVSFLKRHVIDYDERYLWE